MNLDALSRRLPINLIFKIGEMCRKLETEEEKVLPFGVVPPTPRTEEEEEALQDKSKHKLTGVVTDYEVRN